MIVPVDFLFGCTHFGSLSYNAAMAEEKPTDYMIASIKDRGEQTAPYDNAKRAARVYSHWLTGFTEPEIAYFFSISEMEVKRDLQHIISGMSPRAVIAHNNDRARILIQREQSDQYRKMLKDALQKPVDDWLDAGISPVGVMREYRESVSMQDKPGGFNVNLTKNTANLYGAGGGSGTVIRGVEDIIRGILQAQPERQIAAVDIQPEQLSAMNDASDADAEDGDPLPEEQTE